ncbi:hypothetical protein BJV78DRAFT_1354259 [Lactifluus subvellereus]|nr:hypothetical protein BJV78DRAFT_1354259 [Lactifluus subvellereus]
MSDRRYPREVLDSITQYMHTRRQKGGWRGGQTHLLRWGPSGRRVKNERLNVKVASNTLTAFGWRIDADVRSNTYSIAARARLQARITKWSGCAGLASGALSIRFDGDSDLKGGTVIGAGGAKGEGKMDAETDATVL